MNHILKILILLIIIFSSCQKREWSNPFDPNCPKEIFTPTSFKANQSGNQVNLSWIQTDTNISGFVIERSVASSVWTSVATPEKSSETWSDIHITGGKVHEYRIFAKAGTNLSDKISAQITPILNAPLISTVAITNLTISTANCGGTITSDGSSVITARGVCWSTSPNPTIVNSKTSDAVETGTGNFTSNLTGLSNNITYYVRAYATNAIGTTYGNEVSFTLYMNVSGPLVTDIEGNIYNTVIIGTQVWMIENLKTTKYNDGSSIPNVSNNTTWASLTSGAYCWYNNDASTYKATYGGLYNWYVVNTGKLSPIGWHVPTDAEWTTLTTFLGEESVAGGKLKEVGTTHWLSPNSGATNVSGFTALPSGSRQINGLYGYVSSDGYWWSSNEYNTNNSWYRTIDYIYSNVYRNSTNKYYGLSVRCIKD